MSYSLCNLKNATAQKKKKKNVPGFEDPVNDTQLTSETNRCEIWISNSPRMIRWLVYKNYSVQVILEILNLLNIVRIWIIF